MKMHLRREAGEEVFPGVSKDVLILSSDLEVKSNSASRLSLTIGLRSKSRASSGATESNGNQASEKVLLSPPDNSKCEKQPRSVNPPLGNSDDGEGRISDDEFLAQNSKWAQGELVWALLIGHPWWPAILYKNPETNCHVKRSNHSRK